MDYTTTSKAPTYLLPVPLSTLPFSLRANALYCLVIMSRTSGAIPRQSGTAAMFRPSAESCTPSSATSHAVIDSGPDTTGTFVKRSMTAVRKEVRALRGEIRALRGELRAWRRHQRFGTFSENRAYAAAVPERNLVTGNDRVDAPSARRVVGAGFVVGGDGYPSYFVPDVDGPDDVACADDWGAPTPTPSTAAADNGDRLSPNRYSEVSGSDVDDMPDGFVVIDMADATGSVFWNVPRRRRCRRKVSFPSRWEASRDD